MILGESLTLTETVTAATAFTPTSAAIVIKDSTGAAVVTDTPTIDPGTSSATQTLSYTFTPAAVGEYEARFTVVVGSETRIFTQRLTVLPGPFGRAYPDASDLQGFIEAHNITLTAPQLAQLPRAVAYGVSEFERRVNRRMVAGPASVQTFDPPTNGSVLRLGLDLASAPSSVVYQPTNGTAQTWVLGTDYKLEPSNGPSRPVPVPYTSLRLLGFYRWTQPLPLALRQSIAITGAWGYSTDLPPNAQEGMLALGALRMASQLTHSNFGGVTGWGQADLKVSYAADPLAQATAKWESLVNDAVPLYRRWEC